MDPHLSLELLALLFSAAVLAGFVDTLAGGGGLITLPVLLLAQVPPVHALATNKLQGSFGTLTASFAMLRRRLVQWHEIRGLFAVVFVGAALGAVAVQFVHAGALDVAIPLVLTLIGVYFLLAPQAGEIERRPRMGLPLYRNLMLPLIGAYDGFFGPGTGSFFALAGVALRGQPLVAATARAKLLNFASNIASLGVFALGGKVLWFVGGVMVAGQIFGAWLGSHMMVRGGARLIRPLIVSMCMIMIARYAWQKGLFATLFAGI
ncbi:hypothetical protein BI364_04055 [Acidihalobacter yilgarnensis]|uniref:Probable membrane transporter protein n=1 Tax=Acidihalobacter yilgarnensis TaxID=2819280 RepID=A0A1D8ILI6_9GAMM|nr:TSUP family transporter [Acidihalobacter yilgarnensis]AOU97281.1 hypothetical protein BI364_04055 [Acidihalobacter yilgarnensis]